MLVCVMVGAGNATKLVLISLAGTRQSMRRLVWATQWLAEVESKAVNL